MNWKEQQGAEWFKHIDDFEEKLSFQQGNDFKFGEGMQLFFNCVVAKEKMNPDYFIFENVSSMDKGIKEFIQAILKCDVTETNANMVSTQNRKRVIFHNLGIVQNAEDKGILLKDILESGIVDKEKAYCLKHQAGNARDYLKKHHAQVSTVTKDNIIANPVRIGTIDSNSQAHRVYSPFGKSVTLVSNGGGQGAKTGLYTIPVINLDDYENIILHDNGNIEVNGKLIYCVQDGKIPYKDKLYDINLPDGHYIIRKLTPLECEKLQTLPCGYTDKGVSDSQRYKMIGNGWCKDDIKRFFAAALTSVDRDEHIECQSFYDGIATARLILDDLGFENITYTAYEVDKYAMKVATSNYPDIKEAGDAFVVREDDWLQH